jgi:4-hydroxythreonine-4-phosphate dehydrogenase
LNQKPILAITMGDPAGVGPEIIAKALPRSEVWELCSPLVIGDADVMEEAIALTSATLSVRLVETIGDAVYDQRHLTILDLQQVDAASLPRGRVTALAGHAAAAYIECAVELAQLGHVAGIVTCPINKAAFQEAGVPYIGHTEMLAELTGEDHVTTMLATTGLRVIHVTRHVPLREVADHITCQRVLETIRLTDAGLRSLNIAGPRIAVAALNPHGGDGGLVGREEIEEIEPAVTMALAEGIDATGPIPADSVFFRAIRGEFDAVVAMYHDQGHIPIKTHGFERSVTVTLGLPIARTSVDHGTAFDIAWTGAAHDESLVEAIRLAAEMVTEQAAL